MAFNLREKLAGALAGWKARMAGTGVQSVYATVTAAALWPIAQAAAGGDVMTMMGFAAALGGSVGANLLANQLQHWKDEADAARQIDALPIGDPRRADLDAVLEKLEVISMARAALAPDERSWFQQTLCDELRRLGNLDRFQIQITGEGNVAVQGNGNTVIPTRGDGNVLLLGTGHEVLGPGAKKIKQRGKKNILNTGPGAVATKGSAAAGPGGTAMVITNEGPLYFGQAPAAEQAQAKNVDQARLNYLRNLAKKCEVLPLAALGEEEGTETGVTLDQVYVALNTKKEIPLTKEEKAARKKIQPSSPGQEEDTRPLTAMEVVSRCRRLVLLGDPGAGKSTFVNQLLANLAGHQLDPSHACPSGIEPDLVPILIVLRDLVPQLAALDVDRLPQNKGDERRVAIMREQVESNLGRFHAEAYLEDFRAALDEGRFMLVLDGLDEVPYALQSRGLQLIGAVLNACKPRRVIATCRLRSSEIVCHLAQFEAHVLAPFDESRIREFVAAWYQAQRGLGRVDSAQEEARAKDLTDAALSEDLRELAANPMLLTTMAIIHQRDIRLPSERVQLYSLAVEVLARRWQKGKTGELAVFLKDNLRLRAALERLAYEAHVMGKGNGATADLPRGKALEFLEQPEFLGTTSLADEFLNYVDQRAGLLVGRGGRPGQPQVYSFPHRTFQEYLAGCFLLSGRDSGRQAREFYMHAAEGDYWRLAARLAMEELRYNDRRGVNQLLDLAYHLYPKEEPTTTQSCRASLWAANMVVLVGKEVIEKDTEGPNDGPAFLKRLVLCLIGLLSSSLSAPERAEAGNWLAILGDPRPEVVPTRLEDLEAIEFCYVPPGAYVMGEEKGRHRNEALDYGYWLGRYPVTVAQFEWFVEQGGYRQAEYWAEAIQEGYWTNGVIKVPWNQEIIVAPVRYRPPFNWPNHPAVGITWYEAMAFGRWLTARFGDRLPPGYRIGLPSEAEWEKAARGGENVLTVPVRRALASGLSLPDHIELVPNPEPERIYPWSGSFSTDRANVPDTGIGATSAMCCFASGQSPCGCLDMTGNVYEWTRSLPKDYPYCPGDGRERPDAPASECRVLRGAAFVDFFSLPCCPNRIMSNPSCRGESMGFRVVASPFVSGV